MPQRTEITQFIFGQPLSWLRSIRSRFDGQLKLRLRITCRSAEWPEGFEAELRSLWGTEGVGIFQLLPLSDADIRLAVAEWNPEDQSKFLDLLTQHNLTPLARAPITLAMLKRISQTFEPS